MSKPETIIAEFEELLKVKEFHKEKKWLAFDGTIQAVLKALSQEYNSNLKEKLDRWVSVTNARYFQYSTPVSYYFQCKMLYRDGFYEAAIILARSICEMICYDYLARSPHPFGNYEQVELENFRTLVKYLALPKNFSKEEFEKNIIVNVVAMEDKNFLKSSYMMDKATKRYLFKLENGKEAKNLNRFHQIFEAIPYTHKENFPQNTFSIINKVYDDGNTYVHARKSPNKPKADAMAAINNIGWVLAHLYIVDGPLTGKTVVSGYSDFPDICQGSHFGMDVYLSPEDAMNGYYNLPSQKQLTRMLTLNGNWKGEWKTIAANNKEGSLSFTIEGEYLLATFQEDSAKATNKHVAIKCFGDYFHLIVYSVPKRTKPTHQFELKFFNDTMLIGRSLISGTPCIFNRIR